MKDRGVGVRFDVKGLARRGQAVYDQRLRSSLEPQHFGRFVAVEPDTELYMGETAEEACCRARAALPGKLFRLVRIGFPAAHIAQCLLA